VVTQEFENATRAVRLSIKQNCAARSQCSHAEVVRPFALRPIKSIKKRGNIKHLRAMLEEIAVRDCAL
jgi:hypothetical protein